MRPVSISRAVLGEAMPGGTAPRAQSHARIGAVLLAAALAALIVGWVVWTSPIARYPRSNGVIRGALVLAFVVAGAYTARRRPSSRFGTVVLAVAVLYVLGALNAVATPAVYTVGRTALVAFSLAFFYAALAFPYGELSGVERFAMATLAVVIAVVWIALLATAHTLPRGSALTDCVGACPVNPFALIRSGGAARVLAPVERGLTVALAVVTVLLVLRKAELAARLPRRGYTVVALSIVLTSVSMVLYALWPDPHSFRAVQGVAAAAGLSFPIALVAGQMRAHVITTWSVTDLLREVTTGIVDPTRLQTLLGDALGDPSLTVLSWHDERQELVGADGRPVAAAGAHRVIHPLVVQGRLVGAVVHDTTIDDAAGLADAIAAASYASLSHRSLQEQVHESRRVAEKAIEERAKLERDLHDGAVQRALALQMGLADLMRRSLHPALRSDVEQLAQQAKALGNDLRKLAHGLYPATLVERGLRDALVEATVGTGERVRIDGEVGALPPFVAHALYFSCLEAVQNVLRHAGSWTVADVRLTRSNGAVECLIADDGVGLDPDNVVGGLGLKSIGDRIGAVGGSFDLDSSFGNGTRVRLRVPVPAEP